MIESTSHNTTISHSEIADLAIQGYTHQTGVYRDLEYSYSVHKYFNLLTVRGSETSLIRDEGWRDWLRNLAIFPWWHSATGWCHGGVLLGAIGIFKQMKDRVPLNKPLLLAGHSLGGGVSLLLATIFSYYGWKVQEWVGFGSLKVFIGRRDLSFPAFGYRIEGDMVPDLPPNILLQFRHPEPLVELKSRNKGLRKHSILIYDAALHNFYANYEEWTS
jgi:hypothetical protein